MDPSDNPVVVGEAGTTINLGITNLPVVEPNSSAGIAARFDQNGVGIDGLSITGDGHARVIDIAFAPTGVFISGTIGNGSGLDFGGTIISTTNAQSGFIAFYNADWTLNWVRQTRSGDPSSFPALQAVAILSDGDVVVGGHSNDPEVTLEEFGFAGDQDLDQIILARLDVSGTVIWRRQFGGMGSEYVYDIVATENDEFVAVGQFDGPTLELGSITLTNIGSADAFVARFDSDGEPLWARQIGTEGFDLLESVVIDEDSQDVFVTGTLNRFENSQMITQKYSGEGDHIWTSTTNTETDANSVGRDIDRDGDLNLFVCGESGGYAAVWKIHSEGATIWKQSASSDTKGGTSFEGVRVNGIDEVILAGYFEHATAIRFDGIQINSTSDGAAPTAFIAKLAADPPAIHYHVEPSGIVLSWSTNQNGFQLEKNSIELESTSWITVPSHVDAGRRSATNSPTGSGTIFRLRKP